ncbi:hypothetical protein N7478_002094 [Penicillium angulare]|uniref:uncharacterized protein n=1 Tax=Penicillium angulare TaxID=116970 RepID=UPI0025422ABD|nr:uncharacterized protein N7478_002094 [Penicillium angulare]KAJ5289064.1 hypothetical protein N7478_002094 [Penicillium angulare]
MFLKFTILSLAAFAIGGLLADSTTYQLVEKLEEVPSGWLKGEKPLSSALIKFRLAVNSADLAAFEQSVIDLSTPGNPRYGQFMNLEQLNSENVSSDSIELSGNWITFQAAVSQAERMFKTEFFYYNSDTTDTRILRNLEYSVPSQIHSYIQLIEPSTRFGDFRPLRSEQSQPVPATEADFSAPCGTVITPDCLRDLYGLYNTTAYPDSRNRLGIAGFLEEYGRHNDLYHFQKVYAPNQTDASFDAVSINGGQNDGNSAHESVEASMDLQYSISLAYHTYTTFYTTAGRGPLVPDGDRPTANESSNEPYLEQLHYLTNLPDRDLPAVITMSYGESEQSVPRAYATATCNLFAQLGARGVSIIFSSGDAGPGGSCQSKDGSYRAKFLPGFPASCPFITSVGGTYQISPEQAISFSGGGTHGPQQWRGMFNAGGRGIPDVAAQANRFVVRDHGVYLTVGGTSASAPVIAGIVSQLNAVRLAHGKPRMGFLNPWLYTLGRTGFMDIVDGGSRGCARSPIQNAGWNATVGWDPVTGLGTPLFRSLAQLTLL